nr:ubiquitin hydrolase [Tanacetum cinerariifolium]
MSWTGLREFADDTITDYSRPSPSIENSPTVTKTNKDETVRKPYVKYAEMYRKTSKSSNVRGNQRNWNNLKSQQLGENFLMKNKACYKCGHFDHLAYDCGVWVDQGKTWAKNNYTQMTHSYVSRPVQRKLAFKTQFRVPRVSTGYWDNGCSRHMTGNISYLSDYKSYDGGYVSFGQRGCKITGKGTIKTVAKASADESELWHRRLGKAA